MIFEEDSDSGGEGGDGPTKQILPISGTQPVKERDRFNSAPASSAALAGAHERSPSLPIATPQVNVEEVDGGGVHAARQRQVALSSIGRARRGGHVKAPSADWSGDVCLARKGSPTDFSFDSDSSESPLPVPYQLPTQTRPRTATMDSDTLALSMAREAMPMVKQSSELSDTGSLIVPSARGTTFSDDSAEESSDIANQERKLLYLMVARCIAYPFNAKYQLETAPPKPKLNQDRFRGVIAILDTCRNLDWGTLSQSAISLNSAENKCLRSEKFLNCLDWYMDNVLARDDVVAMSNNGSFSAKELESIFKVLATKHIMYTNNQLDVDAAELQVWCGTFRKLVEHGARATLRSGPLLAGARVLGSNGGGGGGTGPNREKLYKLFQRILNMKSIEHQILYRVCQVSCPVLCGGGILLCRESANTVEGAARPHIVQEGKWVNIVQGGPNIELGVMCIITGMPPTCVL